MTEITEGILEIIVELMLVLNKNYMIMKMKKFSLMKNQFQMNQYNILQKKLVNKLIKMNKVLKK